MKKTILLNWFWLIAAIVLFSIYYTWFGAWRNRKLYSESDTHCIHKNGHYNVNVDYYNVASKEEKQVQATIELKDCEIIKVRFEQGSGMHHPIELPLQLEPDGTGKTEDTYEGIYTFTVR